MYAFVSYQTANRLVAGRAKAVLESLKILTFLAHEDIYVSEERRRKIPEEIGKANIFVALPSSDYWLRRRQKCERCRRPRTSRQGVPFCASHLTG